MLSMFYALLLVGSGLSFMISGYDSAKRENAKEWLRNIIIMIVLVQSSYFLYKLFINLSATMTSATLSLINPDFFLLTNNTADLGLAIILGVFYLATLVITSLVLTIRYAIVAIGVVFLPIGIFFYFINPLKQYGSLILNSLGIAVFVTFFDAILLIGFSQLAQIGIFAELRLVVLISAFIFIDFLMLFLLFFSITKSALNLYISVKKMGIKL